MGNVLKIKITGKQPQLDPPILSRRRQKGAQRRSARRSACFCCFLLFLAFFVMPFLADLRSLKPFVFDQIQWFRLATRPRKGHHLQSITSFFRGHLLSPKKVTTYGSKGGHPINNLDVYR